MADLIFAALDAPVSPPSGGRISGQFKATWPDTLALLDEELDKLRAKAPTLYVDVERADITRSGKVDGGIGSVRTPGVRLDFLKPTRRAGVTTDVPASFPCARYWTAQHNIRVIALTLGGLRDIARWGATSDQEEQYAGWLRLPGLGGVNTTALQLTPERAAKVIADAHPSLQQATALAREGMAATLLTMDPSTALAFAREARLASHSDAGGSDAAFVTVSEAVKVLARHRGATP